MIAKIESNIKIKVNLKILNYNNRDTNVFHWRKRIRQMRWSEFGGADQMKHWLHQLFCAAHRGFSQIFPWPLQACSLHLIYLCSFTSGYLFIIIFIYLFILRCSGGEIYNQKTYPCLLLFCINKQILQSFTCIFKIILNHESEVGAARQLSLHRPWMYRSFKWIT